MTSVSTLTEGATGVARLGVQGRRSQGEGHQPADRQQPTAGHRPLQHEEHHREADEDEAGDVERQAAEADEGQDECERAQDAGHVVGVLQLEEDAVEPEREEDEGDVGVAEQVQERLEGVHAQPLDLRSGGLEQDGLAGHRHGRAVRLRQQILDRIGLEVDGTGSERLVDGERERIGDGRDGPFHRSAALLRDRGDGGDGVVHDLVAEIFADVGTIAVDGGGRADVGGGGHGGHVGGQGQERTGARGTGARRPHPHHHRHLCRELRLHDLTRGLERATGSIELDDDRCYTLCSPSVDARA